MPLTTINDKLPLIITNLDKLKMRELKLITFGTDDVTMGKLYEGKEFICYTIERPWLKNAKNVSCIPAGTYPVKLVNSPKFRITFEVKKVPGRAHILFHAGNAVSDSLGCILPASSIDSYLGKIGGKSSGRALTKLLNRMEGESFNLTIERW